MSVRVRVECAWCDRILRAEVWPTTPGVTDGDVSGAICPDCARVVALEAARLWATDNSPDPMPTEPGPAAAWMRARDAWLYQPQPWGLWAGVREGLFWVAMVVAFGVSVRLLLAMYR